MYRAKTENCLIAIRKFLDEPSDKIEQPDLNARLGRSAMPLRLSENFRIAGKQRPPRRTAYNLFPVLRSMQHMSVWQSHIVRKH